MAILIDPPAWPAHGGLWSHLISDQDYEELHTFAAKLGVPRRGFDLDHYDVPASLYEPAIARGALPVTAKDVVAALRGSGLRVRQVERQRVTPLRRAQYLLGEWDRLGRLLSPEAAIAGSAGVPGSAASEADRWRALGTELLARWNEPHRSYHDERHLEDVLLALNHLEVRGERVSPVTLTAAWFHDAVYTAHGSADETDSARFAHAQLSGIGVAPAFVSQVSAAVIATTPAAQLRDPHPALAHLLDADLAIFAASPTRYEDYAAAVRAEYAHVPDGAFAVGRLRILAGYLERPFIYSGETARNLWETRAQANVAAEVERLAAAIPSTGNFKNTR